MEDAEALPSHDRPAAVQEQSHDRSNSVSVEAQVHQSLPPSLPHSSLPSSEAPSPANSDSDHQIGEEESSAGLPSGSSISPGQANPAGPSQPPAASNLPSALQQVSSPAQLPAISSAAPQASFEAMPFQIQASYVSRVPIDANSILRILDNLAMAEPSRPSTNKESLRRILGLHGAVFVAAYDYNRPNPQPITGIWPNCCSSAKMPVHYRVLRGRPPVQSQELIESSNMDAPSPSSETGVCVGRPKWKLPVELVRHIAGYLGRDDVKSLRLASRELNLLTSGIFFKTVVVRLSSDMFDIIEHGSKPDIKGKKRAAIGRREFVWKDKNGNQVYDGHGLNIYRETAEHITRYGVAFEVDEDLLACPPHKPLITREDHLHFDEDPELLGAAAGKLPQMKLALSGLSNVKELAVSIDSGLGWLTGPDRSIRARVLQRPLPVFGGLRDIPDCFTKAQQELWRSIQSSYRVAGRDILKATLYRVEGLQPLADALEMGEVFPDDNQPDMPFLAPHLIRDSTPHNHTEVSRPTPGSWNEDEPRDRFFQPPLSSDSGVLFTSSASLGDLGHLISHVIPSSLTAAQKEWLMETGRAQRAFMSSYMLSIIKNPVTFQSVHTLTVPRLPDHFLAMLECSNFWDALPTLNNVTLMVVPSWRTVKSNSAGLVTTAVVSPFAGMDSFYGVLSHHIACRPNIKSLTFGWATGGEHAEGLHARNALIMPAPLMRGMVGSDAVTYSDVVAERDEARLREMLLRFPYVEELTMRNCWVTPDVLLRFSNIHDALNLEHMVLDSVSLTGVLHLPDQHLPQPSPNAGAGPPVGPGFAVIFVRPFELGALRRTVLALNVQLEQLSAITVVAHHQAQITTMRNEVQDLLVRMFQLRHATGGRPLMVHRDLPLHALIAVAALRVRIAQIQQQMFGTPLQLTQANSQLPFMSFPSVSQYQPRDGSWLYIIDRISPGLHLSDFGNASVQTHSNRNTSLKSIEFISCGYAKLDHAKYHHEHIGGGNAVRVLPDSAFDMRRGHLAPAMLNGRLPHLGQIMHNIDVLEFAMLDVVWNLTHGWNDAEESEAATFDGQPEGRTSRFSNKIQRSDKLVLGEPSG